MTANTVKTISSIFIISYFILLFDAIHARHMDNRNVPVPENRTLIHTDNNCLQACLDECTDWRNSTFTSDECVIPCAVYVEESERLMNEKSGQVAIVACNDTHGSLIGQENKAKPDKPVIRMTRSTVNFTEVWWKVVPNAMAYKIQVWCDDRTNSTILFEDETWLTWYAFRRCHDKCDNGHRARVAAWNRAGVGEYSEFSDKTTTNTNATVSDGRRRSKVVGIRVQ